MKGEPRMVYYIGDFLRVYLPVVKSRDTDTIESYRHSINLYVEFLSATSGTTLIALKAEHFCQRNITTFMGWLQTERKNVAPTVNHRLADIRGFCKYLMKKKAITIYDYEEIRDISEQKDNRVIEFTWLSVEDITLVLEQPDKTKKKGVRDRFFLALMYESGARNDEILSLRVKDIKPIKNGDAQMRVFGKGGKHRITPISIELLEELNIYAELFHPARNQDALMFYTIRNGRAEKMSADNVQRFMKDYEQSARITKPDLLHLHPHMLRRTRAMHLYQAGMPLPLVSEWLGHSNIETTRFYAKITEDMKHDALRKLGEGNKSVFKNDVAFKYTDNEEVLKRLCGLK